MKKYFNVLRKCPLFNGISDENLTAMLGCLQAKNKKFPKKENIFSEGDPAGYMGIVLSGAVQIVRQDYFGNRSIIGMAEPGDLFAESFACAGAAEMPVDVVASEDAEVLLIHQSRISNPCSNACAFHRQMIFNLMKIIAAKNIAMNQKLEITSKRSTREKLMAYLLMQAKKNGSNKFTIPYDRQELADFLGVDRSGLSAEISKLRAEDVLKCYRNQFEIL